MGNDILPGGTSFKKLVEVFSPESSLFRTEQLVKINRGLMHSMIKFYCIFYRNFKLEKVRNLLRLLE